MFIVLTQSEIVLLHIFQKKTRATPKADLETARKRQKEVTS
jgi:phage-related protein